MPTKDEYVKKLNLTPHPEGGWYRQVYHSAKTHYDATSLASRYEYTSIYFILDGGSPSHLHRLLHDELWYFHDGSSIVVHCFYPDGTYEVVHLGRDIERGEQLQFRVPAERFLARRSWMLHRLGWSAVPWRPALTIMTLNCLPRNSCWLSIRSRLK